jgi:hypothetical protein
VPDRKSPGKHGGTHDGRDELGGPVDNGRVGVVLDEHEKVEVAGRIGDATADGPSEERATTRSSRPRTDAARSTMAWYSGPRGFTATDQSAVIR